MKTRIIFFNDFHNIKVNNLIGIEKEGYKEYYKKLDNELIEIIFCKEIYKARELVSESNINKLIFVVEEVNEENISLISDLYAEHVNLVSGGINAEADFFKRNCYFLNNIIYFPQLAEINNIVSLDLFIAAIKNEFVFKDNHPMYILAGETEKRKASSSIPIFILKRFEKLQNLQEFHLKLYNAEELNIADISYIEDCMREYIKEGSTFKINHIKNNDKKENTYFILEAK